MNHLVWFIIHLHNIHVRCQWNLFTIKLITKPAVPTEDQPTDDFKRNLSSWYYLEYIQAFKINTETKGAREKQLKFFESFFVIFMFTLFKFLRRFCKILQMYSRLLYSGHSKHTTNILLRSIYLLPELVSRFFFVYFFC